MTILRSSLYHIVEKRQDARERYVKMALDTLTGPFEVWLVAFTDGSHRLAFIEAYASRRQMLVSVAFIVGRMLWNFMHTDAKWLNKHRHGTLLFKRYEIFQRPKKRPSSPMALNMSLDIRIHTLKQGCGGLTLR